jgi:hypothetical protein
MVSHHPNVGFSAWNNFRAHCSPFLFCKIIDGAEPNLSVAHTPWARGFAVASDYLLNLANYKPPKFAAHGYKIGYHGRKVTPYRVTIRSVRDRNLWVMQRYDETAQQPQPRETLVVSFAWTPFVTTHFKAALCLASYAVENKIPGLKWV